MNTHPSKYEPLTTMVAHLRQCRCLPGSAKRFIRKLSRRLDRGEYLHITLTEPQQACLRELRHKYRKQIEANMPQETP